MCSNCIEYMEACTKNKFFECCVCNEKVSSTNIINKFIYNISKENINNEFDIIIRSDLFDKFELKVTKYMTVKELKLKIAEKKNIRMNDINLAYKKPLFVDDNTLEFYGITKSCYITMFPKMIAG